jgi:hypothetical protein
LVAVAPVLLLAAWINVPQTVSSRTDATRGVLATSAVKRRTVTRTSTLGSACTHVPAGPLVYHWPIKPFAQEHAIRGYFGDPRTVGLEALGADHRGSLGSFTFHGGVDISAPPGTPVYPVVSGIAHVRSGDFVSVTTDDGRTFQYFHIQPAVGPGQPVTAGRTVLGRVKRVWKHVHLGEIDHFRVHNPLDPGHLEPYRDHTIPDVAGLTFTASDGSALAPTGLHGLIQIVADAHDLPAMPVPGHWFDFPVTPALITWSLTLQDHLILRRTVVDFRHTRPAERDFWRVYAPGTYQNFPDFDHHFFWRRPGRYLFNLTPTPLDTRLLANGMYTITVTAADTCGNQGRLIQTLTVNNSIGDNTTINHSGPPSG